MLNSEVNEIEHKEQVCLSNDDLPLLNFREYLFGARENRLYWVIGVPAILLQFIIFKYFYPFAGYINGDSYLYLETAYHNFAVNTYPIGYSKFLRLISVFTHSDTVVVTLQYLLLEISTLALVFTLFYFYKPLRSTKVLLFSFMIINPVYLYLANYISSDAFFLALSLIWFTLLIWIMYKPTTKLIVVNSLILFIAFTVRYNALFYPLIGAVSLLLARRKLLIKVIGFAISLALIMLFIQTTSNKYKELSGYQQFTPFTGWQMANNALYAYRYVDSSDRKNPPIELRRIDNMVRNYFDSSRDIRTHPVEALIASTVYMWDPRSPLSKYMEDQFRKDSTVSALKKWSTVAPLMKQYGTFLIKAYPVEFTQYYLIPNAVKYYAPPVEFLDQYSTGIDSVNETAKVWFNYKSNKITCRFKDFKVNTLEFYPVMTGTMNVVFVLSAISFLFLRGYKQSLQLKNGLALVVSLWVVNFGFSVFASPIALRFQLFPILVSLSFTFLLVEFLVKSAKGPSAENTGEIGAIGSSSDLTTI